MANQPKKYKKFVATAATATLVASAIVPVASAAEFKDVAGNTHAEAINALADAGIINGYADGTFKPNQTINRGQVVKLLGRWLEAQGQEVPADWKTEQRFNDLPVTAEEELVKYAALAKDAGVFNGSNGNLNYTQSMQRQQMAVVLVRAINEIAGVDLIAAYKEAGFKSEISDLDKAYSAEQREAIVALEYAEITQVSNFNPANSVTRGQFASFLHRTIEMDVTVAADASIKAINNTTVEVTFDEEVTDVKALDFAIEGLEISNAAVKQTNKKVVVLTTSAQTADVEYTVTLGEEKIGTFKGVSAVVPTKVELVSSSVQGKLGQQVSVQAKVTVASGQSAAGIPVTFSIPGNNNDAVNPTVTGEAITDANGVATYTYTRYAAKDDAVTAYATGDRSKFAVGYVFWGVDTILSVEEVTTGATANNGANKTYKVTYKDAITGKVVPNKTLNVSFLENIDVQINQISKAKVNGINPTQLVNNSAAEAAQIVTDSKGEALFTVTGENTEVTPVIFDAKLVTGTTYSQAYSASLLQTTASKVKFSALQAEYNIELTRDGAEEAATGIPNGREYKVVVKDKAGNLAKNETVNVAFNEDLDGVIGTQTGAFFIELDSNDNQFTNHDKQITVTTDSKGEASFIIGSTNNKDYATPIAWIDVNSSYAGVAGKLDQGEPSKVGAISYFADAKLTSGTLVGKNAAGKKVTDYKSTEAATFEFSLANQSGKTISLADAGYSIIEGNFTVLNDGAEVVIVTADGVDYPVSPNRSVTVAVKHATPTITVTPKTDKTTSVKVTASGVAKDLRNVANPNRAFTIPTTTEVVAKFTSTTAISNVHTALLTAFNTDSKKITFTDKDAVKYAGETGKKYVYKNQFGNTINVTEFEEILDAQVVAGKTAKVTYQVSDDNVYVSVISVGETGTLVDSVAVGNANKAAADAVVATITALGATPTATQVIAANTAYTALTADQKALVATASKTALETATDAAITAQTTAVPATDVNKYTSATWTAYAAALALPTTTLAEKAAKLAALNTANTALVSAVTATSDGLVITFAPAIANTALSLAGVPATAVASDVAVIDAVTIVTVNGTATVNGTSTISFTYQAGKSVTDLTDGTTLTVEDVVVNGVTKDIVLTYSTTDSKWALTTPVEFK